MSLIEIIILSVGLAMDAFAVSICKGLSILKEGGNLHAQRSADCGKGCPGGRKG